MSGHEQNRTTETYLISARNFSPYFVSNLELPVAKGVAAEACPCVTHSFMRIQCFFARRFSCQCAKDKKIASGLSMKMVNQLEQMSIEVVPENDIYHETREIECSSRHLSNVKTITNKVSI